MNNIEVIISEEEIQRRVKKLSQQLYEIYKDKEVVFICTLKGAVFFACDLLKNYKGTATIEFIKISSYIGEVSTNEMTMNLGIKEGNIVNKHVVIIEDIVDTGITLDYLYRYIMAMKPKSLKTCALLDKKSRREISIDPDYIGFEIENIFVVGYGLDEDQKYRNLPYIGTKK